MTESRQVLADIFRHALAAVDPYRAVLNALKIERGQLQIAGAIFELDSFHQVIVVGAGKATARMALALEILLGERIASGLIAVKENHTETLRIIEQVESSHPVPAENGVAATRRILEVLQAADEKTLVVCLISGGASALLLAPVETITLRDKQKVTQLLLNAGATISELNTVRKHLSRVKGGQLAQAAYPAQVLTLLVSDVIGDPLEVIASGPTAADSSTFAEAWNVVLRYRLEQRISSRVADYLQRGMAGLEPETIKKNDPCLERVRNVIVAGIKQALSAAQEKSLQLGYEVKIISDKLAGEARDAALFLAQTARDELALMSPGERLCLLCGGETTVTVNGAGTGGRNQELALAFALAAEGMESVTLLSAGTDGTDGPCDAAGAMVDGNTAMQARKAGLDPLAYLDANDSYHFFQCLDVESSVKSHLITGPTGSNVMDIQIMLLHK